MSRKARIRAAAAAAVALAIGLLFATGTIQGVYGTFSAETENPGSAFAGGWIPAATVGTVTVPTSPYGTFTLNWTSGYSGTAGTPGYHIASQQLQIADGGAPTGTASCGTYANSGGSLANNAGSTTAAAGANAGDWQCFQIIEVGPSNWTTTTAWTAQKLFVATGLDEHNVTTPNTARNGDQIILTFNQNRGNWNGGNGTADVRFCTTGRVQISTTNPACGTATNFGVITGQTVGTNMTCDTSTTAGNGTTTLTITLAGCSGTGTSAIGAGTATFTPSGTALVASSGTNLCSSAATPNCIIATTTDRF